MWKVNGTKWLGGNYESANIVSIYTILGVRHGFVAPESAPPPLREQEIFTIYKLYQLNSHINRSEILKEYSWEPIGPVLQSTSEKRRCNLNFQFYLSII